MAGEVLPPNVYLPALTTRPALMKLTSHHDSRFQPEPHSHLYPFPSSCHFSHCEKAIERDLKCPSVHQVSGTLNTPSHLFSPAPCEVLLRHQFDGWGSPGSEGRCPTVRGWDLNPALAPRFTLVPLPRLLSPGQPLPIPGTQLPGCTGIFYCSESLYRRNSD